MMRFARARNPFATPRRVRYVAVTRTFSAVRARRARSPRCLRIWTRRITCSRRGDHERARITRASGTLAGARRACLIDW